jgi:predicted alpha/beta superfamily hydrolase
MIPAILACSHALWGQHTIVKETTPLSIGEKIEIRSKILHENRILNIYLPNGYATDPDKTYPVIYLLDGSIDEDFIHIAGLVQFGSFSWISMIPESIVVGIANVDRERDFTYPTRNEKDKKDFPTAGGSENFVRFIESELQPLIERTYGTDSTKTIIGQSLGGVLVSEILFEKPDLFDNYIIVSPSLWWDDESLLSMNPVNYSSEKSVYIAVGKEGEVMERTAKELYNKLKYLKTDRTNLYFEFLERQDHGDALHLAVYDAFEKIFRKSED